jgi:hypothetical protein
MSDITDNQDEEDISTIAPDIFEGDEELTEEDLDDLWSGNTGDYDQDNLTDYLY